MSSFFSFFYSKPKTEEVMATTSLTSEELETTSSPVKTTTEDPRSEPPSPVNLLSPSRITQPQSSQLDSQPKSPKEQDQPSNSYTDDEILLYIAENNELNVSWLEVKKIIKERLTKTSHDPEISIVINGEDSDKNEGDEKDIENYMHAIIQLLDNFDRPPFTIQRLSELIVKPFQHHKTLIKWLRAVEKVLTVQSSMDMFPSITNTVTLTDKLELMEVTTSPKLVPISFAYNAEEIEKENANSPKLVPIKFAYNAGLDVAENEESDDEMNEDYFYAKRKIVIPKDDLDDVETFENKIDEMIEGKKQDFYVEENDDVSAEKSEQDVKKILNKKRDYDVEDNSIEEKEENVEKMIKKKKEDNVENKMIEVGENISEGVENLLEVKSNIKEEGTENDREKDISEENLETKLKEDFEVIQIDNLIKEKHINVESEGDIDEKEIKEKSEANVENIFGEGDINNIKVVSEESVKDNEEESIEKGQFKERINEVNVKEDITEKGDDDNVAELSKEKLRGIENTNEETKKVE